MRILSLSPPARALVPIVALVVLLAVLLAGSRGRRPVIEAADPRIGRGGDPLIERRPVWFGEWIETPVIDRERLAAGWRIEGPAIVEEAGGTTVAPPGWTMEVDATGALMCEGNVRW